MFITYIRFTVAVLCFVAITLPCAMLATLSAVIKRPWTSAPVWWGRMIYVTSRLVAGVKVIYPQKRWMIGASETVLVIANHPPQVGFPFLYAAIAHLTGRTVVSVVAKDSLNPLFRVPLESLGLIASINREDRSTALLKIMQSTSSHGRVLLLFPDQSRYSRDAANLQRQKYKNVDQVSDLLDHVLIPKTGGFIAALTPLEKTAVVMDLTLMLSRDGWSDVTSINWVDATLTVDVEYFHALEIPREERLVRSWLMTQWRKKAALMQKAR